MRSVFLLLGLAFSAFAQAQHLSLDLGSDWRNHGWYPGYVVGATALMPIGGSRASYGLRVDAYELPLDPESFTISTEWQRAAMLVYQAHPFARLDRGCPTFGRESWLQRSVIAQLGLGYGRTRTPELAYGSSEAGPAYLTWAGLKVDLPGGLQAYGMAGPQGLMRHNERGEVFNDVGWRGVIGLNYQLATQRR